jgi:hypothetical protein
MRFPVYYVHSSEHWNAAQHRLVFLILPTSDFRHMLSFAGRVTNVTPSWTREGEQVPQLSPTGTEVCMDTAIRWSASCCVYWPSKVSLSLKIPRSILNPESRNVSSSWNQPVEQTCSLWKSWIIEFLRNWLRRVKSTGEVVPVLNY